MVGVTSCDTYMLRNIHLMLVKTLENDGCRNGGKELDSFLGNYVDEKRWSFRSIWQPWRRKVRKTHLSYTALYLCLMYRVHALIQCPKIYVRVNCLFGWALKAQALWELWNHHHHHYHSSTLHSFQQLKENWRGLFMLFLIKTFSSPIDKRSLHMLWLVTIFLLSIRT